MLFSKSLLSQWVQLPSDNQELQSKLIAKVFEIEHGAKIRTLPADLVLGKTTSVEKHPNADTLFVCQVDCGSHGNYQICTGGENIAVGQYVPVALPGCHLPIIDLTIGERKMRGLDSNGMICSKGELGINQDEDKHWIRNMGEELSLSDDMIGKPLQALFPERENIVFEVESVAITNRPDLWGHFGLAAECRSVFSDYQTSPTQFDAALEGIQEFSPSKLENLAKHDITPVIETPKVCYYSLSKVVSIINDKSVFQGRLMLTDLDHTPRQNWVDYSNWFMEAYGQPIHVFDADSIAGTITVTEIKANETFVDLTGKEHQLISGDIVIRDNKKILALGGIIGGLSCAFSDSTKNILVEVAHFDPIQIRKTATRLGLRTDASMRFEKAINPLWTMYCSREQTNIISKNHDEHKTGEFAGITHIHYTNKVAGSEIIITVDIEQAVHYLQGSYNEQIAAQIQPILQSLGYDIVNVDKNTIQVSAPLRRSDINMIQDIYEDLARHIGLENIPEIPSAIHVKKSEPSLVEFTYKLAESLVSTLQFYQVESYPWYSKERIELLGVKTEKLGNHDTYNPIGLQVDTHFELANPTDTTTPYMAQTLLPGLLEIAKKNYRQVLPINIFEIGKVYTKDEQGNSLEKKVLAALIVHKKNDKEIRQEDSYLQLKRILGHISHNFQTENFSFFGANTSRYMEKNTPHPERSPQEYPHPLQNISYFHPAKQAEICLINPHDKNSHFVGHIGQLHPQLLENVGMGAEYQASFLEIELEPVFKLTGSRVAKGYKSLQDQVIARDLSFEIPVHHQFSNIIRTIEDHPQVSDYSIFDLYKKDNLKSISITVSILGDGATTTDQINEIMNKIIQQVELTGAVLKGQKA